MAGLRVPRTLVSQDPAAIRAFFFEVQQRMVIKTVRGSIQVPLLTRMIETDDLSEDVDKILRVCPAIYQEYVPGTQHIRAHCFGDSVYSTLIESETLDWRTDYGIPMSDVEIDDSLKSQLLSVMKMLGLKMGVCDLKIAASGEPVWLEVNPQGQFLFIEGITGMKLSHLLAEYFKTLATGDALSGK
jgi:glutathione synthase/RimK-type ligase-like ATP-grasp enzyme